MSSFAIESGAEAVRPTSIVALDEEDIGDGGDEFGCEEDEEAGELVDQIDVGGAMVDASRREIVRVQDPKLPSRQEHAVILHSQHMRQ